MRIYGTFLRTLPIAAAVYVLFPLGEHTALGQIYDPSPFTGFYIGLQGGYSITNVDVEVTDAGGTASDDLDIDGFTGGLYGGYSAVTGRLFGGIEAEGSLSAAEYDTGVDGFRYEAEQRWTLGVSALAGVLARDDVLVYGRLGYVATNFEETLSGGGFRLSADETLDGLRVGGGVDVALNERTSVRAEYTYTDYEDQSSSDSGVVVEVSPGEHLFRVGVAYRLH
jgi:outer membrane immunogenic protein